MYMFVCFTFLSTRLYSYGISGKGMMDVSVRAMKRRTIMSFILPAVGFEPGIS